MSVSFTLHGECWSCSVLVIAQLSAAVVVSVMPVMVEFCCWQSRSQCGCEICHVVVSTQMINPSNGIWRLCHILRETIIGRITFCGGYFDVAAGREAPRWVGWTGLDGRASRLRLLLTGFECQQTKRKMHSEKVSALFSRNVND